MITVRKKKNALRRFAGGSSRPKAKLPSAQVIGGTLLLLTGSLGISDALSRAQAGQTTVVAVATQAIGAGTALTGSELAKVRLSLPKSVALATGISSMASLVGRVTSIPLDKGEIVTPSLLMRSSDTGPSRLVTVPIDPTTLAASQLVVGDRVDVAVTYGLGIGANTQAVATSLPIEDIVTGASSIGAPSGDEVTLKVSSLLQALAILQGENAGKVALIMSTGLKPPSELPTYPPIPTAISSSLPTGGAFSG